MTDGLDIKHFEDWVRFDERLRIAVSQGLAESVKPLRTIWVKGEEWYRDIQTSDYYVYVRPDAPILPRWEKVDNP